MGSCKCVVGAKNSGITSKQKVSRAVAKDVYVALFKADGTPNFIDLTAELVDGVLPEAFFIALAAQIDPAERWFPTPASFVTVAPAQADARAQTFPSGLIDIAGKGIKSVQYQLNDVEPIWGGKIQDLSCDEIGTYTVDECGGLEGVVQAGDETKLYPKPINNNSFDVNSIPGDLSPAVELINITYQFALAYQDRNRRYLPVDAIGADLLNLWRLGGLVDIVPTFSAVLATGWTMDASTCFGYPIAIKATGLLAPDFALVDGAGAPVVITTVTEQPLAPGVYDFVIPPTAAQTVKLSRTQLMLDKGFDMATQSIVTP